MKVIYSALIGGYDSIPYISKNKDWKAIMFTDMPESDFPENSNWEYKLADLSLGSTNPLVNRWYKMHPHKLFKDYNESVYIDSNIIVKNFSVIENRIKELKKKTIYIAMPEHFCRNCIYQEGKEIILCQRDSEDKIHETIKHLKSSGYPKNNGLYENNFIYRRHNEKEIGNLMDQWWEFINTYSERDQMSLMFLLWKNNIKSAKFFGRGITVRNHEGFEFIEKHKGYIKPDDPPLFNPIKDVIKVILCTPKRWCLKLCGK